MDEKTINEGIMESAYEQSYEAIKRGDWQFLIGIFKSLEDQGFSIEPLKKQLAKDFPAKM